jgi:hypothetical protein
MAGRTIAVGIAAGFGFVCPTWTVEPAELVASHECPARLRHRHASPP